VAGRRSLVRRSATYRPAAGDGDTPCALANIPRVSPQHIHIRREGHTSSVRYRVGACGGWLIGGARLDGLRRAHTAWAALQRACYGAHRGGAVGIVALPYNLLGERHFLWSVLPGFLPAVAFYVGSLPAYRVLMVWAYERTGESMQVAMLMHASFSASMLIQQPLGLALVPGLAWNLVLAAALWVVVGAVALAQGGHLSRQPLRRRVA
jgi:hypothetical protein